TRGAFSFDRLEKTVMRNDPGHPASDVVASEPDIEAEKPQEAIARLGERRSYAAPYESLTFTLLTRARRELIVTLAAQPVFDLVRSTPVARLIRRCVRHRGGESALLGLGPRTPAPADPDGVDTDRLRNRLDLRRIGQVAS